MLQVPQNGKAILELLGDTEDAEYPIFRTGQGGTYTLVTVLIDLQVGLGLCKLCTHAC